jgi:uncharacterized membrane protein
VPGARNGGPLSRGRAEAFSDGVFAVAITVLIFNVHVDTAHGDLAAKVLHAWPSYAAYVASFLTIGVMWINHHRLFTLVARVDRNLLLLNLVLLMCIVFVPFPTSLLAEYIRNGTDATTAALVYGITATVIAIAFQGLWLYMVFGRDVLIESVDRRAAQRMTPRFAVGLFVYAASILVALISPFLVLPMYALIAIYYAFEQLPVPMKSVNPTLPSPPREEERTEV